MKIAIISDIHIDCSSLHITSELIDVINKRNDIDALLIAGDITEDYTITQQTVQDIVNKTKMPTYYVPGNHDLWNAKQKNKTTQDIVESYKKDPNCLFGRAVKLSEQVVVIGHTGWYDYSYGNKKQFSDEMFASKTYQSRTWQDHHYVHFNVSDQEMHQMMLAQLEECFKEHQDKHVILMTHMVNHHDFLVPTHNEMWQFFNAFLGSADYEALIKKYKPRVAICGHVHYRKQFVEGETTYVCACLGTKKEYELFEIGSHDLRDNIEDALVVIDF